MAPRRETLCALLDLYGNALSGRCREVLEFYYADDLSLAEISENLGITRQGVHDAIRRGEQELLALEKALGFSEKAARAVALAEEIARESAEPETKELAGRIADLFTAENEGDH
ncbi:MAG: DNA-binding protein [Clostridiales bacterium]|nr:DNA-binding protein [Candidatus Coliplasma caballi]